MLYSKCLRASFNCSLRQAINPRFIHVGSSLQQKVQNAEVEMPPCDYVPEPYEGTSFEKAKEIRKTKLSPGLVTYYKNPVYIWKGHMQWLWDTNNKRYLDFFAGIVTVGVGHCHPHVNKAAKAQMDKLWHTTNIYMHPSIHEYADMLTERFPGNLKVCHFVNSGSEANDLALLMARIHTGNFDIVHLRNSYHGTSSSLLGVLSHSPWKPNAPISFGNFATMNPDVYRGPWGGANCRDSVAQTQRTCNCSPGQCEASDKYVEQLKDMLIHCNGKKVAGFIAETIQGVGGSVHLPKGYLKKAYELIRERGGLCISDEVQTGFGRLGSHYWGFEANDVMPDIVTLAKGIGNGYPMGAVITTPEISASFAQSVYFNTYGGNPVASAVGKAVLEAIDSDKLQENCNVVGTYLLEEALKLQKEFPGFVGDVRGKGLMTGMEMVTDPELKTPMPADQIVPIWEDCKDMGLLLGKGGLHGNVFRIKPPMCITKDDVNFAISVMRIALQRHADRQN
ncbi:alanine--glyoxylate aminotransferase 2, mitochondrial-like [Actinia tenebrosa]|uniref:Alanine--glyoxylate aminotransferase 2, mitochondrial n=1 Tax=Actinia tenebrosa TaxID=6105 RepID=A0A6P8J3S5_ACTTE|nr:alanine--glyoxylate aminotransferase 2, mitochondrial-like [Actinia tenebrosa]